MHGKGSPGDLRSETSTCMIYKTSKAVIFYSFLFLPLLLLSFQSGIDTIACETKQLENIEKKAWTVCNNFLR